jgi:pilus assembly protein FimV
MPAPEQAWYQNTMTLAIAGGALLLVGLLALMRFMRKPKPVVLVDDEGDVLVEDHHHQFGEMPVESEAELLDALAQHPGDPDLSLKLLRMYYAERDASKFEAAAEAMYAHIADPTQPEWQEVKAMGEDLVPHNPLFGGNEDLAGYMHEGLAPVDHRETPHASDDSFDLGGFDADGTPASEENFDFDLTDRAAPAPAFEEPAHAVAPPVVAQPTLVHATTPAEDFFTGEDTIGTKLDLARAYLDMGDPEGARSMLDEVMSEGNDTQKGEARKLLAEIR